MLSPGDIDGALVDLQSEHAAREEHRENRQSGTDEKHPAKDGQGARRRYSDREMASICGNSSHGLIYSPGGRKGNFEKG